MTDTPDTIPTQLYLISPPIIENMQTFAQTLDQVLATGAVSVFQLRLKAMEVLPNGRLTYPSADSALVKQACEMLIPVCHKYEVPFILNDTPELALELGADGVHMGQEDGSVIKARELLGDDKVIGVSCHDSKHLAMIAGDEGADYVAFGAFFPTTSKTAPAKEKWGVPSPDILDWWTTWTTVPCVAIGGITPQNCSALVAAGADFLAVITSIWKHERGPVEAVQEFGRVIS